MKTRLLRRASAGALALTLIGATGAVAATIETDATLSANASVPTSVQIGDNAFQVRVSASGTLPNNRPGTATVTTKYFMASDGTITASAALEDRASVTFADDYNYSSCPAISPPQGCSENPFMVSAVLVVPSGVPSGTTGLLTVAHVGSQSLDPDATPDSGYVKVNGQVNTAPTVSVTGVADGASYGKGAVPLAMCSVTDAEDGPSSFPATLSAIAGPYAADGIGSQTASCSYTDEGGLTASASKTYSIVDLSPPTVAYTLDPEQPDGDNGWYTGDVTLTWTVTENESPGSLVKTGCVAQSITADQLETTYGCSATSAGGSTGLVEVKIQRDATVPTVSLIGGPADGASYYFGSVPAAPSCSASDATSGLAGACSVSGYSNAVGPHTVKASATDNAGNEGSESRTYEVKAWTLSGFYAPVDLKGTLNTVKAGSTVPLKFEVFAGEEELRDTSAIKSFTASKYTCSSGDPEDPIEITSSGGTSLRFDTTGDQFIQNWQTPKAGAGDCYLVRMTTQDGSFLTASFKLK